jgi:hypothetical protein
MRIVGDFMHLRLLGTYPGIVFAYLGFGSPLSIFIFHGFIKNIPYELEEAATIDGCSKQIIFFRIVFPLLKPIIVTVLILNGIWIWNDYLLPWLERRGTDHPHSGHRIRRCLPQAVGSDTDFDPDSHHPGNNPVPVRPAVHHQGHGGRFD